MSGNGLLDPKLVEQIKGTPRLSDMVYDVIHHAIVTRRIEPGEWLRQETLAQELGVSQVTVREALGRLVAEGLAVREPYRGVRVITLSPEDLEDIYEMRALLEGFAFELAASQICSEDLARMRELLPRTVVNSDPSSTQPAREANREFHWIAIRVSQRRHLLHVLGRLWDLVDPLLIYDRFWVDSSREAQRLEGAAADMMCHSQLLEALEAGDGKLARDLAADHVQSALGNLKEFVS